MDGNKDEAFKCLEIAKASIQSGDKTRALKFLNKARRLDPSIQIDDLLSNLNDPQSDSQTSHDKPFNPLNTGPRRRVPVSGGTSSPSSSVNYTEEQVTVIREIKRKKNYYDILGLEKSCSSDDVRKAYRKLSLKVHPDKNNAPGAEEAFKMVSKAFQCLSDEGNRKKYDLVGSDEAAYEGRAGAAAGFNGSRGFNGFHERDVDAEEIFRNFFFGGMHPATTANFGGFSFGPGVRVRTGGVGVDHGSGKFRSLIQLLPILLILLVNFMPSYQPVYSLSRTYSYDYRFTTLKGVNFYVKSSNFEQRYPPNSPERVAIEEQVENEYHTNLMQNCRHEWQQVHWGYRRDTPNCDALKRFEAVAT